MAYVGTSDGVVHSLDIGSSSGSELWETALPDGEAVSMAGTHPGHNIPDEQGHRYCINLCSVAHPPPVKMTQDSVRAALRNM